MYQRLFTPQQRGMFRLVVAVIGLGLLVALAVSLNTALASRDRQPSPASVVATNPASWKTYTNTSLGYAFEYPKDWRITDSPVPETGSWIVMSSVAVTSYGKETLTTRHPAEGANFNVNVGRNIEDKALETWMREHEANLSSDFTKVGVNGIEELRFRRIAENQQTIIKEFVVGFEKGKRVYIVDYSVIGEDPEGKLLSQLERILSTFALLDQASFTHQLAPAQMSAIVKTSPIAAVTSGFVSVTYTGFRYPIDTGAYVRTTTFLAWISVPSSICSSGGIYHPGEDWARSGGGGYGDPVYAVADGTIVDAVNLGAGGGGKTILIEHGLPDGSTIWSMYTHLARMDRTSGSVTKGTQIGTVGDGEGTYAPHLHWEIRIRDTGYGVCGWSQEQIRQYYTNPSDFVNSHPGNGCCLCSSLGSLLSGGQVVEDKPSPLSTLEYAFPASTPTAFLTTTPPPASTEESRTALKDATSLPSPPALAPTARLTSTPSPTNTSTATPSPTSTLTPTLTPRPSATPTQTATPTPDTIPPHGSLTINAGAGQTRSLNVTLKLTANDEGGGVAEMRFSHDGTRWSEWESYEPIRTWHLSAENGPHTIYVQFRDAAGNVSEPASATITAALNVEKPSSESYRILSSVVGIGGGEKSSASYRVQSTTGQPSSVAWSSEFPQSSEGFQLFSGYWSAQGAAPCILTGDFDGDHDVDVNDLAFLAGKWRMTSGNPEWKNGYDFDSDKKVTVIDLMSLQTHWGEGCP